MLAAPAPNLSFVIGLPVALLLLASLLGLAIWWVLGKASRGSSGS